MNGVYKREGYWPTLGEAVAKNERVFVFVRSKFVVKTDYELVRENQIDIKKPNTHYYPYMDGQAVVLSTFKSGSVNKAQKT